MAKVAAARPEVERIELNNVCCFGRAKLKSKFWIGLISFLPLSYLSLLPLYLLSLSFLSLEINSTILFGAERNKLTRQCRTMDVTGGERFREEIGNSVA